MFWLNLLCTLIKKNVSNINKYFSEVFKKRDLSGESNPEEDKKMPEREDLQLAIMMPLGIKYYKRSTQKIIFQNCSNTNMCKISLLCLKILVVFVAIIR